MPVDKSSQDDESWRTSAVGMSSSAEQTLRSGSHHRMEKAAAATSTNPRAMGRKTSHLERAKLPLRKRAAKAIRSKAWRAALEYKKSRSCMLFTSITTLVSCVFYIVGTYTSQPNAVIVVEAFFAFVFLMDYVLSVASEAMWLSYVLSFEGIVDLCSIFPVFGAFYRWLYSLSFVRYLRLGKVTRVMRNHRLLDKIGAFNDVTVNACLLGLKITGLLLMTSAIIYGTEQAMREDDGFTIDGEPNGGFSDIDSMAWHDALYFTIVTLSTVGYGDVLPIQTISRMLMIVVILFALTYVPYEVGNLIDTIGSRPKNKTGYSRHLVGSKMHVVLAMVPGGMDDSAGEAGFNARSLRRIIEELCHEDHGMDNESLWVVVMAPCPPSVEVLTVIRSPRFMSRVIYYRGNVMDPMDMAAVCAEYADCIFLYPCGEPPGGGGTLKKSALVETEEKTTLAAKSVQRYLDRTPTKPSLMKKVAEQSVMGVPCRTLVTVKELSSKEQLLRFGINHVICHDELKMSMLACATLFPAFLPFAINAMRSSSDYGVATSNSGVVKKSNAQEDQEEAKEGGGGGGGGHRSSSKKVPTWLRDYKRGMEYELYSLVLSVTEHSCLWGLTFSRAAAELYDESSGKVLLIAVVRDLREIAMDSGLDGGGDDKHASGEVSASDIGPGQVGLSAATEPTAGAGGGTAGPEGISTSGSGRQDSVSGSDRLRAMERDVAEGGPGASFVHTTIFPGDDFVFVGECNVLVLAEDRNRAEQHLTQLQKAPASAEWRQKDGKEDPPPPPPSSSREKEPGTGEGGGKGKDVEGVSGALSPAAAALAMARTSASSASSSRAAASVRLGAGAGSPPGPAAATTVEEIETEAAEEKGNSDDVDEVRAPPAGAGGAGGVAETDLRGVPREAALSWSMQPVPREAALSWSVRPSSAPTVRRGEEGEGRRSMRRISSKSISSAILIHEEEQAEQMEAVREEMRTEDGLRWEEALTAVTMATEQLESLKAIQGGFTEACITEDPKGFFSQVREVSRRLDDAMRVQAAAVPVDLEGHLVIIGAHPRLQYYITAMRRQRPDEAIVVVTANKKSFFELRERVAEAKCEDYGLNITKIFSVCGKNQNRATFEKARVAEAAAVLVVSDKADDSDVLLVSFELEQMLSEIPPGHHAPKVLIDLHNDNSIYYCGNTLARGGNSSMALRRNEDTCVLKETPGMSSATGVWEWPLFAAGMVWTESIMEVFAVQTYFSTEFLAFFETLLQIRRPVLVGNDLVEEVSLDADVSASRASRGGGLAGLKTMTGALGAGVGGPAGGAGGNGGDDSDGGGASTVPPTAQQFDMLRVATPKFRSRRYGKLAHELILKGAMPLGLYRPAGTKGSSLPYTQVNPDASERLVEGDLAFVLRSESCTLSGLV